MRDAFAEYVGQDGETHTIHGIDYDCGGGFGHTMAPDHPDFPAAVRALGEMVESERKGEK